ncbi:MAG: right-handed parallel beta-helix repeat-containing protein [bacterium]
MREEDLYRELLATESRICRPSQREAWPITDYSGLMREETWRQAWDPDARAKGEVRSVTGNIWSDAIERCLQENGSVFIPMMPQPVFIDRPIVLHGGDRLIVHRETRILLKPDRAGTCMVRNAGIVFSQDRPVTIGAGADKGILIEGGIWSDQCNEGCGRGGCYDREGSMPGSHGIFLLHNVSGIVVRNVRFRDCSSFAIQLGNASGFVVEGINLDETADGIHVEGPSVNGIIRHISGKTNDDLVALNAWDWDDSSLTFGPITDVLVEDVEALPGYTWSELRLLPGTKVFPNGEKVACDIRRCVYRNIRGIHTV